MQNSIKLICSLALVIISRVTCPMAEVAKVPLLAAHATYDHKEPIDGKIQDSVSIDIQAPEEPEVLVPDHPATEVVTPQPYYIRNAQAAHGLRYLDCTGITANGQKIVADYLSNEWICMYELQINEKLLDAVISPFGTFFLTSSDIVEETVKCWDMKTNTPTYVHGPQSINHPDKLFGPDITFSKLTFSPDGRYIAAVTDPTAQTKDVTNPIGIYTSLRFDEFSRIISQQPASDVIFSPDNSSVAALYNRATIGRFTIEGRHISTSTMPLINDNDQITSFAFHPDNKHIGYTSYKTVSLLPLDKKKKTAQCRLPENPNNLVNTYNHSFVSCAFRHDGEMLIAGSYDLLIIWDLSKKKFKICHQRSRNKASNDKWVRSIICTENNIIYAIDTQIHIVANCFSIDKKLHTTVLDQDQQITRLSLSKNNILLSLTQNKVSLWQTKSGLLDNNITPRVELNYPSDMNSCRAKLDQWRLAHRRPLRYVSYCFLISAAAFASILIILNELKDWIKF